MTQFDLLLIIAIFLASAMAFVSGFIACYILKKDDKPIYIYGNEARKQAFDEQTPKDAALIDEPVNPDAIKFSKKDDVINHQGVGIVYRPTGAELEKLGEDQETREAKEELAKTFGSVAPPEVQ